MSTHYRIDGRAGAPWITFITGIANDLSLWDGQVPALERDFRILRYDLPGHGGTPPTPGAYSIGQLSHDLLELLDQVGVTKTHLVGLGLGGAIAQAFAIEHSNRLHSLAACCCRARMVPEFAALWRKLRATVQEQGLEAIVEPTVQRWFSDEFKAANPDVLEKIRTMIRGTTVQGYLGVTGAFLELDIEHRLHLIRVPTLYVSGAEDKLGGPPELMNQLSKKVRGAKHVSVPKAAHIANIQNPDAFNGALLEFLEEEG